MKTFKQNEYTFKFLKIDMHGCVYEETGPVYGRLGSGVFDKNGKEIFDGDTVRVWIAKDKIETYKVTFFEGNFWAGDTPLDLIEALDIEVVD